MWLLLGQNCRIFITVRTVEPNLLEPELEIRPLVKPVETGTECFLKYRTGTGKIWNRPSTIFYHFQTWRIAIHVSLWSSNKNIQLSQVEPVRIKINIFLLYGVSESRKNWSSVIWKVPLEIIQVVICICFLFFIMYISGMFFQSTSLREICIAQCAMIFL